MSKKIMNAFRRRRMRSSKFFFSRFAKIRENHWEINSRKKDLNRKNFAIYLLPNVFTTAALFCGFFSIVQAMNQLFETSAVAIFSAIILDGVDGRIARMTKTQSSFGEQYDSLSDMVSFGVAPALVSYEWILKDLGKWGWLAAFSYCASVALRLARFNSNIHVVDKRFFQGLPSPAAAALIVGFVWLNIDNTLPIQRHLISWIMFSITIYSSLTMVSNALFYSGKALDMRYRVPFSVMILLILGFILISSNPPIILFGLFIVYAVSGYIIWIWKKCFAKKNKFIHSIDID